MNSKKIAEAKRVSAKHQAPLAVGDDWREFAPLELLPSLWGALAVFPEMGYYGATVRDVARAASITVPTLYYYHGNKQHMLIDLLTLGMGELLERSSIASKSVPDDVHSQFDCLVEVAILHVTNRVELAKLESEIRYLEPANRRKYMKMRHGFEDRLIQVVDRGVNEGVFAPEYTRDACRSILGMIQGVTMWYHRDGDMSPSQIAERYVKFSRRIVAAAER